MSQETQQKINEEFKALPLDQKFANLFQMEVATFSEAVKYVADNSMKVLEQVGDAISDFGAKVETEAKKAENANAGPANEPRTSAEPQATAEPKARNAKRKPAEPPNDPPDSEIHL